MTEMGGDPAGLVGPAFYATHGENQIPVAAVLVVITIDGDEEGTKSTYVMADGQEPIVVHAGMVELARKVFARQLDDAVDMITGDDDE